MLQSTSLLLILLSGGETLGLTFTSTNFGTRSSIVPPMKNTGIMSKLIVSKRRKKAGADRYNWQSYTCLTSTYVEARHEARPFSWLPSLHKPAPLQSLSKLLQRKRSKRLLTSIILAAIVVFSPAFSPARAASTSAAASSSVTASAAASGISPAIMPFSTQSRALGTFNFIPTKAELELCFRLLYGACCGAFIGLERSSSDRPAGIRTMALVGLGASIYTICSTHGFLPHMALGYAPGSPFLANVKCDISRMAASIASGVGFIGAGAIHKSKLYGNGTEAQNVVAGLTTAAAIWVSAAVGIASAVGLYLVGAVATFSTVAILKYAYVSKEDEPGFSWKPRPLDVVDQHDDDQSRQSLECTSSLKNQNVVSGLVGKHVVASYDPQKNERYSKNIVDPRFEQYIQSRLVNHDELQRESKALIGEEQEVFVTGNEQDASFEP